MTNRIAPRTAAEIPFARPAKTLALLNPAAGGVDVAAIRQRLEECFAYASRQCEIREIGPGQSLTTLAAAAVGEGFEQIIVAGGDGSAAAAAEALVNTGVALGVVPSGTGNLLARELRIPLEAPSACSLLASGGRIVEVDVMRAAGRVLVSHVGLGLYSMLVSEPTPAQKRLFGRLAYFTGLRRGLQALRSRRTWRFEAEIDGQVRRIRASLVLVANAGATSIEALRLGPSVRPDDGQLDLCIMRGRTIGEYGRTIWALLSRRGRPPRLEFVPVRKKVILRSSRPLPVQADVAIPPARELEIEILPRALRVIAPLADESGA